MQKITQAFLWLFIFCLPLTILAQEPSTEKSIRKEAKQLAKEEQKAEKQAAKTLKKASQTKYLVGGLNFRYGLIQDLRMSGLTYTGTGPGLILAYRMRSPKVWEEFVLDPSVTFQTSNNEQALLYNPYAGFSYRYLRHLADLGTNQDWHLYLGGELEGRANARILSELGNSAAHWEGIGALNLAAGLQKDIKLPLIKTPVGLDYQLMIPVFAYVNRGPSYALTGLDPQNHVFTSIWGLPRLNSELGITFPIAKNNPNKLRVAYRWDFYGFNDNDIHPVRSAQHGLAVELLLNLSKQ